MNALKKIAFVAGDFLPVSPAQQILDRLLMGYSVEATIQRLAGLQISVIASDPSVRLDLGPRTKDFHIDQVQSPAQVQWNSYDGIIIVPKAGAISVQQDLLMRIIEGARKGVGIFVYGVLAEKLETARSLLTAAAQRGVKLFSTVATSTTWHLPGKPVIKPGASTESLVVAQGEPTAASLDAFCGLCAVGDLGQRDQTKLLKVTSIVGDKVWVVGDQGLWSRSLLGAALSRSDSPLGDPALDGRTQDLLGLGLLRKLVVTPRAWLFELSDKQRVSILILTGAVNDMNMAVKTKQGPILSSQIYRGAPPYEQHYCLLVDAVVKFLSSGARPWPETRELLVARAVEMMAQNP